MATSLQAPPKEVPKVSLNDGVQMPILGFGTSGAQLAPDHQHEQATRPSDPDEAAYEAIKFAIKCGYRFFDTAALYMNEEVVGRAIQDSIKAGLVARSDLFVCTKVWNTAHKRASVVRACRESLERLRLDYIDLYLIHWPVAYVEGAHLDQINPREPNTGKLLYSDTHYLETWQGMEDAKSVGLCRSIGLSNFNSKMIDEILSAQGLRYKPSVLQVELHPYLSQEKLHAYCNAHNILLNAYCPLGAPGANWRPGQPKVIEDELIGELASLHGKSRAQIILRYHIERGIAPIPKSSTPSRIRENLQIFDFELTSDQMLRLMALNRNLRYCLNTAGEYVHDHQLYPFHEEF